MTKIILHFVLVETVVSWDKAVLYRLATGYTVRGLNPGGGENFRTGPVLI
jgi:hypothetical protein